MRTILAIILFSSVAQAAAPSIVVTTPASSTWTTDTNPAFDVAITDAVEHAYGFVNWNSSLTGWWRWENDATDESGNSNTGTLMGTASYAAGYWGQAVAVDGDTDYIYLGRVDEVAIRSANDFTLAIWVYWPDASGGTIINKGGVTSFALRFRSSIPRWQLDVGDGTNVTALTHNEAATARWSHAAVTWDHSTDTMKLYVDGSLVDTDTVSVEFFNVDPMEIGIYCDAGTLVDDFLIFDRVLDATEIARLHDGEAAALATSFAGAEMQSYTYTIKAVNESAEVGTDTASSPILVDVANTGPIVTLTSPGLRYRNSGTSQTLTASVVIGDSGTTLSSAILTFSDVQQGDPVALSGTSDTASFSPTGLSGTNSWNITATDDAANTSEAAADGTLIIGQHEYYVDDDGDAGSAGTIGDPYDDIADWAASCEPGDICYLRAGTYRETVTPTRGGNAYHSVTIQAYTGEEATISGADLLSTSWTVYSGNIYQATATMSLPEGMNQLFANGTAMMWARWPNCTDVMEPVLATCSGSGNSFDGTTFTLQDGDLDGWGANELVGAICHATWATTYRPHAITGAITANTPATPSPGYGTLVATMHSPGAGRGTADTDGVYYVLGNNLNLLDAATEWVYSSGTLYFYSPGGDTPANYTLEVKARTVGIDCNGLEYVDITNVDLFACNITTDADSSYVVITGTEGQYISEHWVIDEGDMGVGHCHIHDSGIILDGDHNTITQSTLTTSAGNGVAPFGNNATVSYCDISRCNYALTGCANICTGTEDSTFQPTNCVFSHNRLRYAGRNLLVHQFCKAATITYNDLSYNRWTTEAQDLGATYAIKTDGESTVIAYNVLHHLRSGAIYWDNHCSNMIAHHNICYDVDFQNYTTTDIGIHINDVATGHLVYNNTCVDCIIKGQSSTPSTVVRNNIADQVSDFTGYGGTADHNILVVTDVIDPLYTDSSADVYTLTAASPCINAGTTTPYTSDFRGLAHGQSPDAGAYEYGDFQLQFSP